MVKFKVTEIQNETQFTIVYYPPSLNGVPIRAGSTWKNPSSLKMILGFKIEWKGYSPLEFKIVKIGNDYFLKNIYNEQKVHVSSDGDFSVTIPSPSIPSVKKGVVIVGVIDLGDDDEVNGH